MVILIDQNVLKRREMKIDAIVRAKKEWVLTVQL